MTFPVEPDPFMPQRTTLFSQLGEAAVGFVVEKFMRLVLADPDLAPAFEGHDVERIKAHQKAFVVFALGGPNRYSGRGLRNAHARFHGVINDAVFDKVLMHLARALSELGVDAGVRASVLQTVNTVRPDVLGT